MKIILFIILFLPLISHSQNIITTINISGANEYNAYIETIDYVIYTVKISPGYRDHFYKFVLTQLDTSGMQTILTQPEIKVDLTVYRNDYKRSDGKVMWDYKTEVKSNDIWTDDWIEIGDCSNQRHLTSLLKVKNNDKYLLRIYYATERYHEYSIENGEAKER